MKNISIFYMFVVCCLIFVSCDSNSSSGRSGGEVPPTGYKGETSRARITENNAKYIAVNAIKKQQNAKKIFDVYGASSIDLQKVGGFPIADESIPGRMEKSVTTGLQACLYGGKIFIDETVKEKEDKIIKTVYVDFMNCNQDNVTTLDGEARAEITLTCLDYDPQWEMCTHYSMNMKMEFIEITADDGERSETLTGTFEMADEPDDDQIMMITTKDMLVKDNNTKKTYKMYDMVGRVYQDAKYGIATEAEGRFYHHDYGYIDIYTVERLKIRPGDTHPSEGEYLMEGANGTEARVFFIDSETLRVTADTNGNGVYDYDSGHIRWSS